jgi:hypothetical protein
MIVSITTGKKHHPSGRRFPELKTGTFAQQATRNYCPDAPNALRRPDVDSRLERLRRHVLARPDGSRVVFRRNSRMRRFITGLRASRSPPRSPTRARSPARAIGRSSRTTSSPIALNRAAMERYRPEMERHYSDHAGNSLNVDGNAMDTTSRQPN